MGRQRRDIIETILGPSDQFTLSNQVFNAITFSGILISLLIFFVDNLLEPWKREHNFTFGLAVAVAYIWLYGKSRESGHYKDYTIFYVFLELFLLIQSWFMYGGIVGISILVALHFIVTVSMILDGRKKNILIVFILFFVSFLFFVEISVPGIVRSYSDHKYLLIDFFIFFMLISCGIIICISLIIKNNQIQYENIEEINLYLDKSKKNLEEKIIKERESQAIIQNSLKEKELLLREIHHRVKNNLQIISSILLLQQNKSKNIYTVDAFDMAISRIRSIAFVHDLLYRSENISYVDFKLYIEKIVFCLSDIYKQGKNIDIEVNADCIALPVEESIACGLIVTELVSNSMKHAFLDSQSGIVLVSMSFCNNNQYRLCVLDNGIGFSDDDVRASSTLGLLLVRELVEGQLNGTVNRVEGVGTYWKIEWISHSAINTLGESDGDFKNINC